MDEKKSKVKSTLKAIGIVWVIILVIMGGIVVIVEKHEDSTGKVHIEVEFDGNLILDKYDVEFLVDGRSHGIIRQGTTSTLDLTLSKGSHTVTFCREGVSSVKGSAEFKVEGDMQITYAIKCHAAVIDVEQL